MATGDSTLLTFRQYSPYLSPEEYHSDLTRSATTEPLEPPPVPPGNSEHLEVADLEEEELGTPIITESMLETPRVPFDFRVMERLTQILREGAVKIEGLHDTLKALVGTVNHIAQLLGEGTGA